MIRKNLTLKISCTALMLCIFVLALPFARSEEPMTADPEEIFRRAASYYDTGQYDKAVAEYSRMLKMGLKSGGLYYNLGNSYLKMGLIGKAILNYKRSRQFMPRDSALLVNYRYALSRMKQRDANAKLPFLVKTLTEMYEFINIGEAIMIFLIPFYIFAILVVISKFVKNLPFIFRLSEIVLFLAMICAAIPLYGKINEAERTAIVISPVSDTKFEPLEDAAPAFPLYEGMKLHVLKSKHDWRKVRRPDGKIGWARAQDVESISE